MRTPRSVLAVPGSNPRMAEKALASGADAVFLDLEDAVAPDEKAGARQKVANALKDLDWRGRTTLYRINALDTPFFYRDLIEVVEEAGDRLDAVMVPKVNAPEDLHAVATLLYGLELATGLEPGKIRLEAQIESAEGLVNVDAIARATGRLEALHFDVAARGTTDGFATRRVTLTSPTGEESSRVVYVDEATRPTLEKLAREALHRAETRVGSQGREALLVLLAELVLDPVPLAADPSDLLDVTPHSGRARHG